MASKIVPGNIDGLYPTAGQDNSSQGFRNNFTSIVNNFTEAKTEIEALQTNKASTNASSNFTDNIVSRAVLKDTAMTVYAHGTTGGAVTLNHENGHWQTITTNASVTLAFTNWPAAATVFSETPSTATTARGATSRSLTRSARRTTGPGA